MGSSAFKFSTIRTSFRRRTDGSEGVMQRLGQAENGESFLVERGEAFRYPHIGDARASRMPHNSPPPAHRGGDHLAPLPSSAGGRRGEDPPHRPHPCAGVGRCHWVKATRSSGPVPRIATSTSLSARAAPVAIEPNRMTISIFSSAKSGASRSRNWPIFGTTAMNAPSLSAHLPQPYQWRSLTSSRKSSEEQPALPDLSRALRILEWEG